MNRRFTLARGAWLASIAAAIACLPSVGSAQNPGDSFLFGDFESGLGNWEIDLGGEQGGALSIALSSTGVTEGSQSLEIETGPNFGRDVIYNADVFDPIFQTFSDAAADPTRWTLDYDVTFTVDSWADVTDPGGFFILGAVGNSDGGFIQQNNVGTVPPGSAAVRNVSIPVGDLNYVENSSFYQFWLQTNSNHVNGPSGEGVKYYVDNVRLTFNGDPPVFVEDQLFSWETADDPGTPDVDESFEGWVDGFEGNPPHIRTIDAGGATDGANSLKIETDNLGGFTWGSQFVLDAGEEEGDPSLQPQVTDFIDRANDAVAIAWDVTVPTDQFPNAPTFLQNFIHIGDDSETTFFQAQLPDLSLTSGETQTLQIDLADITDVNGSALTAGDGFNPDSTFFRIALASNTNDNVTFFIDNMRFIGIEGDDEVPGDANGDGAVDLLDLDILGQEFDMTGPDLAADFNDDGTVDLLDLDILGQNFGTGSATAVPEPGSALLATVLLAVGGAARRRG